VFLLFYLFSLFSFIFAVDLSAASCLLLAASVYLYFPSFSSFSFLFSLDAYYYLYYDLNQEETVGLEGLPTSFLSMDTENRVIRLDSFSKLLCPGLRMGMVAGPPAFIEKYILLQEVTDQVIFVPFLSLRLFLSLFFFVIVSIQLFTMYISWFNEEME
jgi:hypothetical protein